MRLYRLGGALGALACLVAGCSSTSEFRPLDAGRGVRPELAAARYDIEVDDQDVGDAKVWSGGPVKDNEELGLPGDPAGLLQVGVRLRNDGPAPMRFVVPDAQLEVRTEDDRTFVVESPIKVIGDPTVAPRSTERLGLIYVLPPDVTVADLIGYELLWSVDVNDTRVSRSTPFTRERHRDYPGYYYRPYYYPYYYPHFGAFGPDPWGWRWGFGAGAGFGW